MAEYAWLIIGALIFYFYTISCIFFTVRIAALKGRRRRWGWLALFFGILGFGIVCFLPNAKGISGETNPLKAAFRKIGGLSPLATWLMVVGLVVVVGGALLGNRLVLLYENRAHEKELSNQESEKENVMAPAAVIGEVAGVFAGDGNNYAITKEGDLYGWGALPMTALDEEGRLYKGAKKIATVGETTLLLTKDGALYGKGDNKNGLIIGAKGEKVEKFTKIETDVSDFSLGECAAALITERKNLYLWGKNTYGQLGIDADEMRHIGGKLASNVKKVVMTARSVYYLNESGEVYGIGNNAYGQFAKGDLKVRKAAVKIASGCKDMAAGEDFLMILKKDGTVWTAGNDSLGQLGRKTIEELSEKELEELNKEKEEKKEEEEEGKIELKKSGAFGQVELPEGVSAVYAAGHSAFAVAEGELYAWGENHLGQLGTGNRKNCAAPKAVYGGVASLSAGGECTLLLLEDGSILGAGDRRDWRLGAESKGNGFKAIARIKEAE